MLSAPCDTTSARPSLTRSAAASHASTSASAVVERLVPLGRLPRSGTGAGADRYEEDLAYAATLPEQARSVFEASRLLQDPRGAGCQSVQVRPRTGARRRTRHRARRECGRWPAKSVPRLGRDEASQDGLGLVGLTAAVEGPGVVRQADVRVLPDAQFARFRHAPVAVEEIGTGGERVLYQEAAGGDVRPEYPDGLADHGRCGPARLSARAVAGPARHGSVPRSARPGRTAATPVQMRCEDADRLVHLPRLDQHLREVAAHVLRRRPVHRSGLAGVRWGPTMRMSRRSRPATVTGAG